MPVSSIASATNQVAPTTGQTAARLPTKVLGQSDFLKLLSVQFQTQDPMKPMEDTAFIAQMAQFTSLSQSSQMATDMNAMRADQAKNSAAALLGRDVLVSQGKDSNGNPLTVSGNVTGVDTSGTAPQLLINGKFFPYSAVIGVTLAAAQPAKPTN